MKVCDVIDLDGTCSESPHVDKKQDITELEPHLGEFYLNARPYHKIISLIKHTNSKKVIFTGRKTNYINETEIWIRGHLFQRRQYEIHYLGFVNYEMYVETKVSKIVELLKNSIDEKHRVFEDDLGVLDKLESALEKLETEKKIIIQLIMARDGKAWRRTIILKKKR